MDAKALTSDSLICRIADDYPRGMSAYFLCLCNADKFGNCKFYKQEIRDKHCRSWTKFKNDLRGLAAISVLEYTPYDDVVHVKLVAE
jgi:hypothetical protein